MSGGWRTYRDAAKGPREPDTAVNRPSGGCACVGAETGSHEPKSAEHDRGFPDAVHQSSDG